VSAAQTQYPAGINPNPKITWMIDYALKSILPKLFDKEHEFWIEWANDWLNGERNPARCVRIANRCFDKESQILCGHTLGQLAWGAKESCYNVPQSGWLALRYVADAMVAYGIAFPDEGILRIELK
jgi:hypothetical protein